MQNLEKYIPAHAKNTKVEVHGLTAIFEIETSAVVDTISELFNNQKLPLKAITATDERKEHGCFKIWYIFGIPEKKGYLIPYIQLKNTTEFPSITPFINSAWNYERRIQTFFGLTPVGHPDTRPLILHENWPSDVFPLRKDFDYKTRPATAHGTYEFQKIGGEGIYEIPVGPIHAGIIEPGHFRFSVAGEEIMNLEARLGFMHKGSEKLFELLPLEEKVRLSEKISGDSSFSHSLAFCQTVEALAEIKIPKRAAHMRVIFAELERLANHFGDIGAIMLDTGFNFGGANGARLREMIMQISENLTSHRFLRGTNTIGGVTKDINDEQKKELSTKLNAILKDFSELIEIAENSASLFNRLKNTGMVPIEIAEQVGMLGVAARAMGIAIDTRKDFPYAAYEELGFDEIATEESRDVNGRFHVRIKEVIASIHLIQQALHKLPEGAIHTTEKTTLRKNSFAVSAVEGWRGEIIYFIKTDSQGNIDRVTPRDPSFLNWSALGYAGLKNIVPDFPLINKSFNLSYTGNDL